MTIEQAMDTVVKVTGEFKGNRQDHALITEALKVIHEALVPKELEKDEEE